MICIAVLFSSCSKVETSKTTSSSSSSTTLSETAVILTVKDVQNNIKSGYTIMMFTEKVQLNEPLPTIEKQIVSDSEGIVKFDLNDYIVNPTKLYFEAFVKEGNNYIWKSISHPEGTIKKGTTWTTSIFVE